MLRLLGWIVGGVLLLGTLLFVAQWVASESGEVVVLHAPDETGELVDTRLWVVDHDGSQWLRVGADRSGWFARLTAAETIELTRGDSRARYVATPEPAHADTVNALMQAKYGWSDSFIASFVGGRDGSIPVRLVPIAPPARAPVQPPGAPDPG